LKIDDAVQAVLNIFEGARIVRTERPCKQCGVDLVFMKGPKDKTMVFDAKVTTVWYLDDKRGEARSFPSHMPHHATCTKLKK